MPNYSLPINASELLPHKAPMCCIDRLICVARHKATGEVLLRPDHILVFSNQLDPAGFIELAAQTAGAMQGYWQRKMNLPPQLGYLVGVQNFKIYTLAQAGDLLTINIETIGELEGVSALEASIYHDSLLLAEGRLKVFVADTESLPA